MSAYRQNSGQIAFFSPIPGSARVTQPEVINRISSTRPCTDCKGPARAGWTADSCPADSLTKGLQQWKPPRQAAAIRSTTFWIGASAR
jgi:hypothetical protein